MDERTLGLPRYGEGVGLGPPKGWTTTHQAGTVPEPGRGCVLGRIARRAQPDLGPVGSAGARARAESLSLLLSKVPEKYADNLQVCGVLVLSEMSKISCYFENGV